MIGAATVPTGTPPPQRLPSRHPTVNPVEGGMYFMDYTIQTAVTGDFDDVVDTTIAALEDEGFGVLCDIDI